VLAAVAISIAFEISSSGKPDTSIDLPVDRTLVHRLDLLEQLLRPIARYPLRGLEDEDDALPMRFMSS